MTDFSRAAYTVIVSDIHLADAEPPHRYNPLWKRFKRPKFFIDSQFKTFLEHIDRSCEGPVELVLNGDIFDFDSVMSLPPPPLPHELRYHWLERIRGLSSEEAKSRFKLRIILTDHGVWRDALKEFVLKGHRLVFVIGNHDIELQWPSVREDLMTMLGLPEEARARVRFCEWFYISGGDTLIEHGNQYDNYSACVNPINPLIKKGFKIKVRTPFGNLAGRIMLNGMGLMNPHVDSSYIKGSLAEYLAFYFKYVVRTQPLLMYTWFWSALATLSYSVAEGLLPAMRDPLTIDDRVEDIARRANASSRMVWSLRELHVHPAIFNPWKVLRELWLDRAIILGLIFFGSFQFFSVANIFVPVGFRWFAVPFFLLLPLLIFYSRSIQSEVAKAEKDAHEAAPLAARIARVRRVVQGHTHHELHAMFGGTEYLNTGTWSPAYHDVECTEPYGRKCFAVIRPSAPGESRIAELYEWSENRAIRLPGPAIEVTKESDSIPT